jgi:hypothetical protein
MAWIVIIVVYVIGAAVYSVLRRQRAGIDDLFGRIKILGEGGVGLDWFLVSLALTVVWPATLIWWLANGRPEPRVVFNEKARERARRSAEAR